MAESVIAVKEETVRVGGAEVTKKTMVAATDEGVVLQVHTVQSNYPPIQSQPMPALPSTVVYTDGGRQANNCCARGWCECDSTYKWYSLYGKGWGIVLLLLLMYLIFGVIVLALYILYCVCACLACCSSDDN